jgi:hypothetical protein
MKQYVGFCKKVKNRIDVSCLEYINEKMVEFAMRSSVKRIMRNDDLKFNCNIGGFKLSDKIEYFESYGLHIVKNMDTKIYFVFA